jgi:hypothetical protein
MGERPLLVARVGQVRPPVQAQRSAVQVEGGRGLAGALGLARPVEQVLDLPGVDLQPAVGGQPQRGPLAAHEERGGALPPLRLQHGQQVRQRDPQVAQRRGGGEVRPQGARQLLAGAAAPGQQHEQQRPHPLPAPVRVVHDPARPAQCGGTQDRQLQRGGRLGRDGVQQRAGPGPERLGCPWPLAEPAQRGAGHRPRVGHPGLGPRLAAGRGRGGQLDGPRQGEEAPRGRPVLASQRRRRHQVAALTQRHQGLGQRQGGAVAGPDVQRLELLPGLRDQHVEQRQAAQVVVVLAALRHLPAVDRGGQHPGRLHLVALGHGDGRVGEPQRGLEAGQRMRAAVLAGQQDVLVGGLHTAREGGPGRGQAEADGAGVVVAERSSSTSMRWRASPARSVSPHSSWALTSRMVSAPRSAGLA